MDPLFLIGILMSAILFSFVGYTLGNYFPVVGPNTEVRDKDTNLSTIDGVQVIQDDRPLKISLQPNQVEVEGDEGEGEMGAEDTPPEPLMVQTGPALDLRQATRFWYDREQHKVYVEFGDTVIDLDGEEIDMDQRGLLSMLMFDIQDKVGIEKRLQEASMPKIPKPVEPKPLRKPSINPVKAFVEYVQADVPELEENPGSIASQINKVLQAQIEDTPLATRGLKITETAEGGVAFVFDGDIYSAVDEITDPLAQQAVEEAVATWEQLSG